MHLQHLGARYVSFSMHLGWGGVRCIVGFVFLLLEVCGSFFRYCFLLVGWFPITFFFFLPGCFITVGGLWEFFFVNCFLLVGCFPITFVFTWSLFLSIAVVDPFCVCPQWQRMKPQTGSYLCCCGLSAFYFVLSCGLCAAKSLLFASSSLNPSRGEEKDFFFLVSRGGRIVPDQFLENAVESRSHESDVRTST